MNKLSKPQVALLLAYALMVLSDAGARADLDSMPVAGQAPLGDRFVVDQIIATIYHPEGNETIILSDLQGSIDGQAKTLKELVIERLMVLDARRYKIMVTDEEVDRFFGQIQKQNGWTRFELLQFLDAHGYTYDDGRELLRNRLMINQVIDYKIRGDTRMVISRERAQAHYQEHPITEEATFTLAIAYVPFAKYQQEKLDSMIKKGKLPADIAWDEPFTLKQSELAQDRAFIRDEPVGKVVLAEKIDDGYELTILKNRTAEKQVPFEDCYSKIVNDMRQEQFQKVLDDYQKGLLAQAHVTYWHPDMKLD